MKYLLMTALLLGAPPLWAQEDGPPQEPPYVDEGLSDFSSDDLSSEVPFETGDESFADNPNEDTENFFEEPDSPVVEAPASDLEQLFESEMGVAEEAEERPPYMVPVEPDSEGEGVADSFETLDEPTATAEVPEFESELSDPQFSTEEEIVYDVRPTRQDSVVVERSPKGGVEYIEHPLAAKGLTEIRRDGSYIYKTGQETDSQGSGAFRLAMMDPPKITAADGTTFEMMYSDGQQPYFSFDFEWQPFQGFGRLGIGTGFGILVAQGNGRFLDPSMANMEAKEKYTFLALPLILSLNYRLQFKDRQLFIPYMTAGGSYYGVVEYRDDGKVKAVGTPGAFGGGGILFNISGVDQETAFTLRNDYGIANLYVSLDYKYSTTFSEDLDFTSHMIGAGIVADY